MIVFIPFMIDLRDYVFVMRSELSRSAMTNPKLMTSRLRQACDGCRFRKVKCYGSWPCTQCAHLNLQCSFSAPAASRKPKVRGGLISQLRGGGTSSVSSAMPPCYVSAASTPRSADFFINLLPQFSEFVYPFNPVISPQEMREAIDNMERSAEDTALIHAFAAMTINRTRASWTLRWEDATLISDLLLRSFRAYRVVELESTDLQGYTFGPLPVTAKRILTCIFLSVCLTTLGQHDRSFAIIREGATMLQTMNLQRYQPKHSNDAARWQRLYWEVHMHERHLAMLPSFSSVLPELRSGLPVVDTSIPPHIDLGFRRLLSLFFVLDDTFLAHWRRQQHPEQPLGEPTAEWVERTPRDSDNPLPELTAELLKSKLAQLDEHAATTAQEERYLFASGHGGLTELQQIDLSITRLWLRTLIWQLALSRGLLRSAPLEAAHEGLLLHFPANSLRGELRSLLIRLENVTSVGFHGIGMLHKLFEITSTIADVLALSLGPEEGQLEGVSRIKDLLFIVQFLLSFEAVPREQQDYLLEKTAALQERYAMTDVGDFITIRQPP